MSVKQFLLSLISVILLSCSGERSDVLVIGTSADNPPYEFYKIGKIQGFDIDLAKALGEEMGREIEIRNMDFASLIPSLHSGHIDMVISGVSYTEKRKKQADFSNIYITSKISVLTKNPDINMEKHLKGKIIGVQLGTTWEMAAKRTSERFPVIKINKMNSNLALVEELKNNNIDAIFMEDIQAAKFIERNPNMHSFELENEGSEFAIALLPGSKLTKEVNKAIAKLKKNGTIDKLQKKWMKQR